VGENDPGEYGASLLQSIGHGPSNIRITGWVPDDFYRAYLSAADVAVQLRAHSRGESSAAVLDAMNHGVVVIANANGSLSSLPFDAVRLLPDAFSDEQLSGALCWAHDQPEARRQLGRRARQVIAAYHSPQACAELYRQIIEQAHARAEFGLPGLVQASGFLDPPPPGANREAQLAAIAEALTRSLPSNRPLLTWRKAFGLLSPTRCGRKSGQPGLNRFGSTPINPATSMRGRSVLHCWASRKVFCQTMTSSRGVATR
jgi:hypothetical protein